MLSIHVCDFDNTRVKTSVSYNNALIKFEVLVKSHYYIPILLMIPISAIILKIDHTHVKQLVQ